MKEWSDEEMDKLFRKSAEELDPPYEPADWNNLRRRLDEADGITPGGGWLKKTWPWLAVGLLLLIGGLGVYYGTGDKEGNEAASVTGTRPPSRSKAQIPEAGRTETPALPGKEGTLGLKEENPTKSTSSVDSRLVSPESGKSPINPETPVDIKRKNTQDLKELPRSLASVSGVRDQPNRSEQERGEGAILLPKANPKSVPPINQNRPAGKTVATDALVPVRQGRQEPVLQTPQLDLAQNASPEAAGTRETQSADALRDSWLRVEALNSRKNYQESEGPAYPVVAYTSTSDSLSGGKAEEARVVQIPKWSVRIGVSPDLSVVRMSDMMHSMRPGPSASLLVERSIGKKFVVQTGIIRSLKRYSAPFSDYHPDKHIYQSTMPVSVDGSCTVFEIPLNVRFEFIQTPRSRWFAGTGVSSYKMQKESYTYNYDRYVHNGAKGWGGSTGWYLLSHANLSLGYERYLTRRLSIMAEPYARLPLRGVGYGKVNLFTTGVWLSLRYSPTFRK